MKNYIVSNKKYFDCTLSFYKNKNPPNNQSVAVLTDGLNVKYLISLTVIFSVAFKNKTISHFN